MVSQSVPTPQGWQLNLAPGALPVGTYTVSAAINGRTFRAFDSIQLRIGTADMVAIIAGGSARLVSQPLAIDLDARCGVPACHRAPRSAAR
jgi:hypothetical protein